MLSVNFENGEWFMELLVKPEGSGPERHKVVELKMLSLSPAIAVDPRDVAPLG